MFLEWFWDFYLIICFPTKDIMRNIEKVFPYTLNKIWLFVVKSVPWVKKKSFIVTFEKQDENKLGF